MIFERGERGSDRGRVKQEKKKDGVENYDDHWQTKRKENKKNR